MRQLWMSLILAVVILVGLWALINRDQIANVQDAVELAQQQIGDMVPESDFFSASAQKSLADPNIRIATFHIHRLNRQKLADRRAAELLAKTIREFDLIAIQGLETGDEIQLRQLLDLVNSTGKRFDFVISPVSPGDQRFTYAFVMNVDVVHLDGAHRYLVQDPDQLLTHPPFVGWFRTVTANPNQSFTFSLVNVCLNRQNPGELDRISEVFRAVRNDGRGEDDIIVVGNFDANDQELESIRAEVGLLSTIQSTTTTRGDRQLDNILLDTQATSEFTGRVGVFDFMNEFNLKQSDALTLSDQMPCWAEFSKVEGQVGGLGLPQKSAQFRGAGNQIK